MADKILSVEYVTASSTPAEINIPELWRENNSFNGNNNFGAQWFPKDRVKYIFDQHTGSFQLVQEASDVEGIEYYPSETKPESPEWRLKAKPPRFLYASGSNNVVVKVTTILIR